MLYLSSNLPGKSLADKALESRRPIREFLEEQAKSKRLWEPVKRLRNYLCISIRFAIQISSSAGFSLRVSKHPEDKPAVPDKASLLTSAG